jgi:hypothetical protein
MSEDAGAWDSSQSGGNAFVIYSDGVFTWSVWSWWKTFYVLPLLGACSLTGLLWKYRSEERGPGMIAWGWGFGWPLGSLVWMVLWFAFGGASGIPSVYVAAAAVAGWVTWSTGMRVAAWDGFQAIGGSVSLVTFVALMAVDLILPRGTGLIDLALGGALMELLPYFKVVRDIRRVRQGVIA